MNYRHGFHAGNFADVFKHAFLARMLVYLTRKDAPLRFIDTHAGAGRYDLDERRRAPLAGMARRHRPAVEGEAAAGRSPSLLAPYLDGDRPVRRRRGPAAFLSRLAGDRAGAAARRRIGSRSAKRIREERERLIAALGRDRRLRSPATDGYVALNAYVPPKERRGLVLIDPPYEEPNESERVEEALRARARANGRAASTCCGGRSRTRATTRIFSTRSPRSARPTCCGSKSTSARSRPARIRRPRCAAPASSSSTRRSG